MKWVEIIFGWFVVSCIFGMLIGKIIRAHQKPKSKWDDEATRWLR